MSRIEKYASIDNLIFEELEVNREYSTKDTECILLEDILKYLKSMVGVEFKIVKSEDFGEVENTFRLLIPKLIKVKSIHLDKWCIKGKIEKVFGTRNILDGPYVLLYTDTLYSKYSEYDSVGVTDFDNGLVIFENFDNIPCVVSHLEVLEGLSPQM